MQKIKQRTMLTSLLLGGSEMRYGEVVITSTQVKALRATPIIVAPAPGAGKVLEFRGGMLFLDYGTNVFTGPQNLAVRYKDGTGVQCSQNVTGTGFIDQAVDTMTGAVAKADAIVSKGNGENQPLVLHNLGAAEITGNAANDCVLRIKFAYRIHQTGY